MLRQHAVALAFVTFVTLTAACDDPKSAPPGKDAGKPVVTAAAVESAKPAATAAPEPPRPAPAGAKKDVTCSKESTVTFSDPTLESVVRVQLSKPDGPIQRAELKKVKTLNLAQAPKNDELDPCIYPELTGVKGLYLAPGKLDDITPLKTLTQLESLRLAATAVKDLKPLAGLIKLDRLDLGRTPVDDLTPLEGMVNLTELQIDETEVTDLRPLAKMKKLEVLLMKRTRVQDVSPLKEITTLKNLYIEGSAVKDVSSLSGIHGLKIHEGS